MTILPLAVWHIQPWRIISGPFLSSQFNPLHGLVWSYPGSLTSGKRRIKPFKEGHTVGFEFLVGEPH
jgi:hypothetical protein